MSFDIVLFPCEISRSAFSGERIFEFNLLYDESYMGVADRNYCLDENYHTLSKESPSENNTICGYIKAYLLTSNENVAYISIPDGEVVEVKVEDIKNTKMEKINGTNI